MILLSFPPNHLQDYDKFMGSPGSLLRSLEKPSILELQIWTKSQSQVVSWHAYSYLYLLPLFIYQHGLKLIFHAHYFSILVSPRLSKFSLKCLILWFFHPQNTFFWLLWCYFIVGCVLLIWMLMCFFVNHNLNIGVSWDSILVQVQD